MTTDRPELTLAEAATRAGVSQKTLQRRIAAGRLPGAHRDSGGRWLIPDDTIATEFPLGGSRQDTDPEVNAMQVEIEHLREQLAEERRGRAVAEAIAAERERAIEELHLTVRALARNTPPSPESRPESPVRLPER
jgi:excisionase family DNA binding protein